MLQAVCVGPVALDPSMTVEAALERIGRRCLTHFLYNEPAARAGEPEGIDEVRQEHLGESGLIICVVHIHAIRSLSPPSLAAFTA